MSTNRPQNTLVSRFVIALPGLLKQAFTLSSLSLFLTLSATPALGQQFTVSGRVVTADLAPVAGASVLVKGTTIRALTNATGAFTVNARSGADTLSVSSLGYQTADIAIAGRAAFNVVLEQAAIALNELVVVGYGVQTRASLSGSVSQVATEDLTRTSATTTSEALVGKLQGLNTRATNSKPGNSTTIQIRNLGQPLVVIDGIPYDFAEGDSRASSGTLNPLDHLNPADIESISILKDASASVYGFRAANGVILVTTKQGTRGQTPRVTIDGYYGIQNITRFTQDPPANAYEFKRGYVESEQNQKLARTITPAELENWRIAAPGFESFNQVDVVINRPNAPQYNLNASVSGGAENANYYVSLGTVKQDWVMLDNTFNRTNLQANVGADLGAGLDVGVQLTGGIENRHNVAAQSGTGVGSMLLATNSSWPMDNPWPNGNRDYVNGNVRFLGRLGSTFRRHITGPQDELRNSVTSNIFANYQMPFGIRARGTYSHTIRQTVFERHQYNIEAHCYDAATDTYNVCATLAAAQRIKERREFTQRVASLQLSRAATIGAHTLSGVVAAEATGSEDLRFGVTSVPPDNGNPTIGFVQQTGLVDEWDQNARQSLLGRFNYDYSQRYLLEVLGRYDGSYLYAPENRWGFFPGVSLAWRPTQEPMLRDRLSFLDDLKLRASWGEAGREQGVNPWDYLGGATYGSGNSVFGDRLVTGIQPRGLPVINLSWVTSTSRNIGVDFVLLNSKISGQFDLFERKLSGLPAARYDVLLPSEVGYNLPNENLESEANRGLEGILTYTDRIGGLQYSISANSTVARRKILERYKPRYASDWDIFRNGQENRWQGVAFRYKVIGRFESMEDINTYPINNDLVGNRTQLPGDLKFEDVNGDKIINAMDLRPGGYGSGGTPIWMYGFSGSFQYQGISLNLDWSGGTMFSWVRAFETKVPFTANHNSPKWLLTDRWHQADPYDDRSPWIPGVNPAIRRGESTHNNLDNNRGGNSSFYTHNVSYLRLKRIEVGYNLMGLPGLAERLRIGSGRVYASVQNPYSFDNLRIVNMDPELTAGSGNDYPTQIITNVGFSVSLGGARAATAVVPVPPGDD